MSPSLIHSNFNFLLKIKFLPTLKEHSGKAITKLVKRKTGTLETVGRAKEVMWGLVDISHSQELHFGKADIDLWGLSSMNITEQTGREANVPTHTPTKTYKSVLRT